MYYSLRTFLLDVLFTVTSHFCGNKISVSHNFLRFYLVMPEGLCTSVIKIKDIVDISYQNPELESLLTRGRSVKFKAVMNKNKPATDKIWKNDPYAGKLKSIAVYDSDCKKLYEIHVDHTHGGMPEHYHPWENGHPVKAGTGKNAHNAAFPLTAEMKQLLKQVKSKVPHV